MPHEDDNMIEMEMLKAVVHEDNIDAVVRSLGHAGIVQFLDMRERQQDWKEFLSPYKNDCEILAKSTDLISRIETAFDVLHINPYDFPT